MRVTVFKSFDGNLPSQRHISVTLVCTPQLQLLTLVSL